MQGCAEFCAALTLHRRNETIQPPSPRHPANPGQQLYTVAHIKYLRGMHCLHMAGTFLSYPDSRALLPLSFTISAKSAY